MTIWSQKFWLYKFMALIVVMIFASSLAVGCWIVTPTPNPTSTPTLTPTPTPGSFSYQVRVEAKEMGKDVRNAEVRIEVAGKADLCGVTDSNGIARIFINSSHAGQPGFLIVEATGYERHEQHIDLIAGALPYVVQLEKSVVSTNPTPETPPTATVTPSTSVSPSPVLTITPSTPLTSTVTPSPTPSDTITSTPEAVVISATGLNLRSGPGTDYNPPIDYLSGGEILDVIGRIASNEWIQVVPVSSTNTISGWVSASPKYVQTNVDLNNIPIVEIPPLPTPAPTPPAPVLASAPTLLEPPDGATVAIPTRLDLVWTWDGTLGLDDYFRVEIWNKYNDFSDAIDVAWVKDSSYKYDRIEQAYDREYRWRITVVRGIIAGKKPWYTPENPVWEPNEEFEVVSEESAIWTLVAEPPSKPEPLPEPTKKPTPIR